MEKDMFHFGRQNCNHQVLFEEHSYQFPFALQDFYLDYLMEKMMRNFFREGNGEVRMDHLVNWDNIRLPIDQGGLGVGDIQHCLENGYGHFLVNRFVCGVVIRRISRAPTTQWELCACSSSSYQRSISQVLMKFFVFDSF